MTQVNGFEGRLRGIYPGWWVLTACCSLALFPGAIFEYGFPVFYLPIQNDLMLSSTRTSLIFALSRGEPGNGGPLVGWLVDRFDSRPIVMISGLMAGVGLIILSNVDNYWAFMLVYVGVVSVGNNTGFGQTFLAVMNRWFVRRRAVGMTAVITCYTAGGAILVPLLSRGIEALGWRDVMLYAGIFVAVIVVPVSMLIRRSPEAVGISLEQAGEAVLSGPANGAKNEQNAGATGHDYSVKEALKTPTYWFIVWGSTLRITVTSGILVHGIPIMVWKGASEQSGADFIALVFFISIPTRFLIGRSGVKLSSRWILTAGMAAGTLSLATLTYVSGTTIIYLFVIGIALLEGAATLNWVMVGDIFGRRNFATLTGIISVFYSPGMMLSPRFLGWVFDKTGGYTWSLLTLTILYAASTCLFAIAKPPKARDIEVSDKY